MVCFRITPLESIQSLRGTLIAKLTDKHHPVGKARSSKAANPPIPADIKTRKKNAVELYFRTLPVAHPEILAFDDDAVRLVGKTCDTSEEWGASRGIADGGSSLLAHARLIKTMGR